MTVWLIALGIFGFWSVFAVGTTGGPNHGEHPLICSVLHALAFAFKGPELPALSARSYWGALALAGVLSVVALRWTHRQAAPKHWRAALRVGLGLAYCAMLALLLTSGPR